MPGQRARRSVAGVGTLGKTSVVLAERIHEAVGPREKYGPNPIVSSLAAQTEPRPARKARLVMDFMMHTAENEADCGCKTTLDGDSAHVSYREESAGSKMPNGGVVVDASFNSSDTLPYCKDICTFIHSLLYVACSIARELSINLR